MKALKALIIAAVLGLGAFTATATVAQAAQENPESIVDIAKPVFDAVRDGNYPAAAALALVLLVAIVSRYAPWAFFKSGHGKALLVLVGAFGGALGTGWLAGAPVAAATFWAALKVAVSAAGGYSLFKSLLVPLLARFNSKLPVWLQPILALILAIFAKADPEEKAKAAGDKAVAANPPSGVTGVIGEPKDVD